MLQKTSLMAGSSKKRVANESLPSRLQPRRKSARISSKLLRSLAIRKVLRDRSTLTEFKLFTKLPKELMLKIWRLAASSRIVSFKKGGGIALGAFSACWEARLETRHEFQLLRKKS